MTYVRANYECATLTLTVPSVDNSGKESNYLPRIRRGLECVGLTGWTELDSTGYWNQTLGPQLEKGTVLIFYVDVDRAEWLARKIGEMARRMMPDQIAIQVTVASAPVTVIEA